MDKECDRDSLLTFSKNKSYPQIYIFAVQVNCAEQEDSPNDLLLNFESQIEKQFQQNWFDHWTRHGHAIVLDLWKLKYNEFLASNVAIAEDVEKHEDNEKECLEEKVAIVEESNTTWEEIFQQHSEEIYFSQYTSFQHLFSYNYYVDFINALQNNIKISLEEADEDSHTNATDLSAQNQITCELEQLKLLGLPTQFGSQSQVSTTKNRKKKTKRSSDSSTDIEDIKEEEEDFIENFENLDFIESITMVGDDDEQQLHSLQSVAIKKAKGTKNRKLSCKIPAFVLEDRILLKYWRKRFSLFSRFDEGIRLDRESWFSVTPEKVAIHLAERLTCDTLVDGFCGSGGNAIQFAKTCRHVIAIDIDPQKIEMARHNASIYNVAERIEFIVGDFFHLAERLRADIIFLSPPWGGPKYKKKEAYDVEKFLLPVGASQLVTHARRISENIALFLPRNSNIQQIVKIAGVGNRCEIEHNYLDTRLVGISALYGDVILKKTKTN